MDIFYEFLRVVQRLQKEGIEYALIGGVAVAFHTEPRFTKDIDLLIRESELDRVTEVLKREGYFRSSTPWTFRDSNLTLHRFMRVEEQDEMIVDVLVAGDERHGQIISNALEAESEDTGVVRVVSKADLIWLKRQRNSKQDEADIARLEDEEFIMVAGSSRPLMEALKIAHVELVRWLVEDYGFDKWEAFEILSQVGKCRIGNVVDPCYTVVAKFPKKYLP